MPTIYSIGDLLELVRWGKFNLLQLSGTIAAAKSILAAPSASPYGGVPPAVEATLSIDKAKLVLTERFNWGRTSGVGAAGVDSVYYELWSEGIPQLGGVQLEDYKGASQGFYCAAIIRESDIDNICSHLLAATSITVKLWNIITPAAAVTYDFTVWYYEFYEAFLPEVREYFKRLGKK